MPGLERMVGARGVFFILYFSKKKIIEIYFWVQILQFYTPTARQGTAGTKEWAKKGYCSDIPSDDESLFSSIFLVARKGDGESA